MKAGKIENDRYQKALDMALALSKERLHNELVSLYLSGSYQRGDFIPGWSDIDITAIVKDEVWADETLKRQFFEKCRAIRKEVKEAYPGVSLDLGTPLGTTSESIVRKKANLALFLLRQQHKILYGQDILKEVPAISVEKISEWGRAATLALCDNLLNFLQHRERLDEKNLVSSAKKVITDIMKIAQNSLLMKGIFKLRKEYIVETFEKEFVSIEFMKVVRQSYELQLEWQKAKIDPIRLIDFIDDAEKFILNLKRILVQKQMQS